MKNFLTNVIKKIKENKLFSIIVIGLIVLAIVALATIRIWGRGALLVVAAAGFVICMISANQPQKPDLNALRMQFQNQIFDNLTRTFARALQAYEDSNKTAKIPTLKDVSNFVFQWNANNEVQAVFRIQKRFLTCTNEVPKDFISQINSVLESYACETPAQIVKTIYGSFVPFYQVCDIKDDLDFVRVTVYIGRAVGNLSVSPEVYNADF